MGPLPRISVVVPMYNVEGYLAPCLESLAAQTVDDFEAVMVDDGSTDGTAAIAREFAAKDPRFRLVTQENGGLSKARNTGIEDAHGEFIAFLDSDDLLPPNAYELLLTALEETGSDFASGNVQRFTRFGSNQAPFLAKAFARTRLKTHITEFRPLLADRTAWNKLWRRSFWGDRRFPEGRVHEDIPVVLPAHFQARSVDVIADPVYLYRIREGADLSITQRRLEPKVLLDRMSAIETVSGFLGREGPRGAKRWYDESVVADDLRYHVNILDSADDDYRALFLDRVNAFLDTAHRRVFDPLLAIDRLKWHLVRRRLMPELVEVLRFEREELAGTPPVRERGKWYGDYPFRTDRERRIPRSVYRLDKELQLRAHLEELRRDGDRLTIRGYAYIHGIGAGSRDAQKLTLSALRPGRLRRLRVRLTAKRLPTTAVHRPDVTAGRGQSWRDLSWSGFEATVDPGRFGKGVWELYAYGRAGGIKRRRSRFAVETPPYPIRAVELPGAVTASTSWGGRLTLEVGRDALTLREHRIAGEALELSGDARLPTGAKPRLELTPRSDSRALRYPLEIGGGRFTARVPLADVRGGELEAWELWAVEGETRIAIGLPEASPGATWRSGTREVALFRSRQGVAALIERATPPLVTGAEWTADGELELAGTVPESVRCDALVLGHEDRGERYAFAVERSGDRFTARLAPARIESLAGTLPLAEGSWHLAARPGGQPVMLARELFDRLPLTTVVAHKPFTLGVTRHDQALIMVQRDLDDDERGPYQQRRLARTEYPARRREPLRDAVVYTSFGGRQYSDSPRAIHEELVRRDAPLEHLWVVRDGRYTVPAGATALREGSREWHEALARARFVVSNDHFPDWFERRPEQACVQTWHGTPFKRLGLDVSKARKTVRRFQRGWDRQVANWQYVVSPNRFSTPILQRAYAIEGEMLETGYPRVDVLARPDRDALSARLRRRLGLPEGVRTVLYAPTYRDHVVDRRGRYRLDLQLDLERLRAAVGEDTVILFRKHHYVADAAPATADGFVRDVSSYPDGTELMLAADVLLTDYSSMMVDYANTGRPMLFYTYDLDEYRDEIRGFYLDFVSTVPGPLLRTTGEVGDALRDLDQVRAEYADRYDAFRAAFCELDDGQAAARVVDRVFAEALEPVAT